MSKTRKIHNVLRRKTDSGIELVYVGLKNRKGVVELLAEEFDWLVTERNLTNEWFLNKKGRILARNRDGKAVSVRRLAAEYHRQAAAATFAGDLT